MARINPLAVVCQACKVEFITRRASTQLPRFCSRRCGKIRPAEERFWAKVNKGNGDSCWEWTACITSDGYGAFGLHNKSVLAHRFSFSIFNGPIPDGLEVCHSCDNPACVRPDHLFLGDHDANMKDAASKARVWRKRYPNRKPITADTIAIIRKRASSHTQSQVASELGISQAYVSVLSQRNGIQWR